MKIVILMHDLSSNSLVRVYPIAKVIARKHTVEIIGTCFNDQIFPAYQNEFEYVKIKGTRFPLYLKRAPEFITAIEADLIYAFKPMLTSFGVGLIAKYYKNIPLLLDIEDWDFQAWLTNFEESSSLFKYFSMITSLTWPNSAIYARLLEPLIPLANQRTVVSSFLQQRFGGIVLVHGADTEFFNPKNYNPKVLREKYGISTNERIILFAGTPRPHKGLDDLVTAIKSIDSRNVSLMLIGGHRGDPYIEQICEVGQQKIKHLGYQPHALMPEFLSIADMVVLPQRSSIIAQAQIPGKLFEAMAMAKPIVATNLSDLPQILDGCGIIVPPEKPLRISEALEYLLANEDYALELGRLARQRCQTLYSWNMMEHILDEMLKNIH